LLELDEHAKELEAKIKEAERKFKDMVAKSGMTESQKEQILKDNLPNQASKEHGELRQLNEERNALTKERAALR